jgi:hypothetical protein
MPGQEIRRKPAFGGFHGSAENSSVLAHGMNTRKIGAWVALVIAALALGCGGKSLQVGGDGGGAGSGGSGGGGSSGGGTGGGGSGGNSDESGASDGSSQGDAREVTCVSDPSDGNWHCGGTVINPCPTDKTTPGTGCEPGGSTAPYCFQCGKDGTGQEYACAPTTHPHEYEWSEVTTFQYTNS